MRIDRTVLRPLTLTSSMSRPGHPGVAAKVLDYHPRCFAAGHLLLGDGEIVRLAEHLDALDAPAHGAESPVAVNREHARADQRQEDHEGPFARR